MMSFRTKFALILASVTLALYTVVGGWISTRAQQPTNDPNAQLRIFESVLQHIQNDYVDEPVYLQDERLSSVEAEENLRADGHRREAVSALVDSEAAAVILRDFIVGSQERMLVPAVEQPL